MARKKLKILLLQARKPEDPAGAHEVQCFSHKTGLSVERIQPHNLLNGPPSRSTFANYDAFMVGGSGDFYVSSGNLPFFEGTLAFLREVVSRNHPMFASCFGYQCMVRAMGGEIIRDADRCEVGTYELELTEEGRRDELFRHLPKRFFAQMGHKDRATILPMGWKNLASSMRSPIQAFRIPKTSIWASQFHPELDKSRNEERYQMYMKGYSDHLDPNQQAATQMEFRESEETSKLLKLFLDLVFC